MTSICLASSLFFLLLRNTKPYPDESKDDDTHEEEDIKTLGNSMIPEDNENNPV
jgi:hypothetical protein